MKYFEIQGKESCLMYVVIFIMAVMLLLSSIYQVKRVDALEHELSTEQGAVEILADMVARDDVLLDQLLHGSWNRDCKYELVPGELLADGSVRSSLIQHCD